jgi:hypothetical protein
VKQKKTKVQTALKQKPNKHSLYRFHCRKHEQRIHKIILDSLHLLQTNKRRHEAVNCDHAWVTAIAHLNRERRQKKSRPTEEVCRHSGVRAGVFDSVACTEGFKGLVSICEKKLLVGLSKN